MQQSVKKKQPVKKKYYKQHNFPEFISDKTPLYLKTYWWMLLARRLEEKLASIYRAGQIAGSVFMGKGQEAISASIGISLKQKNGDIFAPLIREQAGRLAFGEPIGDALRTYLGSMLGPMRARDNNVHRGRPREGMLAPISHLGAMISVANGILLANKISKQKKIVAAAFIGEGATSTGAFHEAINQASVEKIPLILIIANNQYAYSTHTDRQFACKSLADRAKAYGIEGFEIGRASCRERVCMFV